MFGLVFFLVLMVVSVGGFVFWIMALVDSLKRPDWVWGAAGKDRVLWVVVLILTGWIGSIFYWTMARPALNRAQSSGGPPITGVQYLAGGTYGAPGPRAYPSVLAPPGYQPPPTGAPGQVPPGYPVPGPAGGTAPSGPPSGEQAPPAPPVAGADGSGPVPPYGA